MAAGRCDFQQVFTRPDEKGSATVKVFEAKAFSLPSGKHPLLFITSLKVNTDGWDQDLLPSGWPDRTPLRDEPKGEDQEV